MGNDDSVLDITNFYIDLTLESRKRNEVVLKKMGNNNKIKVNNTNIELNFISTKKLDCNRIVQLICR